MLKENPLLKEDDLIQKYVEFDEIKLIHYSRGPKNYIFTLSLKDKFIFFVVLPLKKTAALVEVADDEFKDSLLMKDTVVYSIQPVRAIRKPEEKFTLVK